MEIYACWEQGLVCPALSCRAPCWVGRGCWPLLALFFPTLFPPAAALPLPSAGVDARPSGLYWQ